MPEGWGGEGQPADPPRVGASTDSAATLQILSFNMGAACGVGGGGEAVVYSENTLYSGPRRVDK